MSLTEAPDGTPRDRNLAIRMGPVSEAEAREIDAAIRPIIMRIQEERRAEGLTPHVQIEGSPEKPVEPLACGHTPAQHEEMFAELGDSPDPAEFLGALARLLGGANVEMFTADQFRREVPVEGFLPRNPFDQEPGKA